MLALVGNSRLVIAAGTGLTVAAGGRLADVAGLPVLRGIVWRTTPLRGKAWWRSLHPGIVTAEAARDQVAVGHLPRRQSRRSSRNWR